jgi:hypothetical protein
VGIKRPMIISDEEIGEVNNFKYYGSFVQNVRDFGKVRIIMKMNIVGKRGRGRPRKRWMNTIKNYM